MLKTTFTRFRCTAIALATAAALITLPVPAAAQTGVAHGILYEILEAPTGEFQTNGARQMPGVFKPGPDTFERLAQATERGFVQGQGTLEWMTGELIVQAQSRIPFDPETGTFGVGTAAGTFRLTSTTGQRTVADFEGLLDLSMFTSTENGCPCPLAPVQGTWKTRGNKQTGGVFEGVFLMPFEIATDVYAYYNPNSGSIEPLEAHEYDRHGPLVKLLVGIAQ
jgi:hypothetical protein